MKSGLLPCLLTVLCLVPIGRCLGATDAAAPPMKADQKLPVPTAVDQQAAARLVNDVFKDDIAKAKKPGEKASLAKKLLQAGMDERTDMAGHFFLLTLAKDTAALAGDADGAIAALAELDKSFQIDVLSQKIETLTAVGRFTVLPTAHKAIILRCNEGIDEAVNVDRYDLAKKLADLALVSARKANDGSLVFGATNRWKEVAAIEQVSRNVAKGILVLDKTPTDPVANLMVGKFRCFMKGDWEGGLPMLALGSDLTLKSLAERELKGAANAEAEAAIADDWWNFSETAHPEERRQTKARAAYWYQQAVPHLTGLKKGQAEKRMAEVVVASAVQSSSKFPIVNVLKLIDPKRDTQKGRWNISDNLLTADATDGWAGLQLPLVPKGDYDLTIRFTRTQGSGPVELYLKRMGHSKGFISFDERELKTNAIGNAKKGQKNMTRTGEAYQPVKLNETYTVVAEVRSDKVTVALNGVKLIDHRNDSSELVDAPTPNIMIAANGGSVRFEAIEISDLSSKASK